MMEPLLLAAGIMGAAVAVPLILALVALGSFSIYELVAGKFWPWLFIVPGFLLVPFGFAYYLAACLPFAIVALLLNPPDTISG